MKRVFSVLLWLIPFFIQAQSSMGPNGSDSLIRRNIIGNGRYSTIAYTFSNDVLTKTALKSLLTIYPSSGEEFARYRRQRTVGLAMLSVTVVALVAAGIQENNRRYTPGSQFTHAPVFFSISIAGLLGSLIIFSTNQHQERAIDLYNQRFR